MQALGDYIGGAFVAPTGSDLLRSVNPAADGAPVFETAWAPERIGLACAAAEAARVGWSGLSIDARFAALVRFRDALAKDADALAEAVVLETGKLRSEAKAEVSSLLARFDLVRKTAMADLHEGPVSGFPHEELRHHPLGVVGVIGPFNYPLHLCHAHVIPALLLGNTVVVKPSEVAPLAGQHYAAAAKAAGFPAGVFNLVHGGGGAGAALVANPSVRGICFTGSYEVGHMITAASVSRPELLVALEMGGKNTVVVYDDASLRQAAHEIVVGGFLSAGQRCTATDRVLVHRSLAPMLIESVKKIVEGLRFGHPDDPESFAGPMSTASGRERVESRLAAARAGGAREVVASRRLPGGFYLSPSVHQLPDGCHHIAGYTDTEVFGPDVSIEIFDTDDEVLEIINASPYGFANSLFTGSTERFERFYRETRSGILNRNRSTNLASPRLPFGGVGRSGNYRPAGAHAQRNVIVPVAVQDNVLGTVAVHPMLADHLPEPDLARLARQHEAEERSEAERNLLDTPRPLDVRLPRGGRLPQSDRWLIRLYAGERVVREKKPAVFDHLRSSGPWYVSVDDEPLAVLDGMSQTATVCGGFAEDLVARTYVEGGFGDTLVDSHDPSAVTSAEAAAFADTLRHLVPGVPHVAFCNSGAEANEKALALARLHSTNTAATKVLAFEGSFHGRTLFALHATHSPAKRVPFELAGHQAIFAPYPLWSRPGDEEPAAPSGFYAAAAAGDLDHMVNRFGDAKEDELLSAEVRSLAFVHAALSGGEVFACVIEPMQSEGGDRYATARFFRALRLLTRHHDVALIFDEVQTGFGLGGPFAWHEKFRLVNHRGQPDYPDAVVLAKRAQVGVVMSTFEDPEPSSSHPASLVRGRLHAEMMSTAHSAGRIEKLVKPRLANIAAAFPHLVDSPRACGYAFAFDLPTPAHLNAYLGQRFWRGAIVFGAGSRTVRYRLSEAFLAREIDTLFDAVRRSLSWLDAHPGAQPPEWEDQVAQADARHAPASSYRLRQVETAEALEYLPAILDIEYQVYEPARRTPPAEIRAAMEHAEGIITLAEVGIGERWHLVGFGIGAPVEICTDEGPDRDPMRGLENSLYSVTVTVANEHQGRGLGRQIKEAQLREAARRTRGDGTPRYRFVTGRNRVGHTASMTHLNRAFGAHLVCVLTGQYEDPEGQAIYYRIPLGPIAPVLMPYAVGGGAAVVAEGAAKSVSTATLDLASGPAKPLLAVPASLVHAESDGMLAGPAINKLTLVNYVTPAVVRALEWVGALAPDLPHLYVSSGRDEAIDKILRLLRLHRKNAAIAIGFEGGYVGHTTGAARSISDRGVHRQGPAPFSFPKIAHPGRVGVEASIAALDAAVEAAGGAAQVFGCFFEVVQERTGEVVPNEFWPALASWRAASGVPIVVVETASAMYRSGRGVFATSGLGFQPDVLAWWCGGQTGFAHVSAPLYVSSPLTLVSTWDGDESSMVRLHHQLRALRGVDVAKAAARFRNSLAAFGDAGITVKGLGLHQVAHAGDRGPELHRLLDERGIKVRLVPTGALVLTAPADLDDGAAARLATALREVL